MHHQGFPLRRNYASPGVITHQELGLARNYASQEVRRPRKYAFRSYTQFFKFASSGRPRGLSYSRLGGYDGATRRVPAAPKPCGPPAQAAPKQVLGSNLESQIIGNGLLTCAVPRVDQKPLWPQIPATPKTCGPKSCGPQFPWT